MISNIQPQTNNNYSTNLSFKAIPRGSYRTAKNTFVNVVQLEKSDLPYITRFCENLEEYYKKRNITDYSRQYIMKDSFNTVKDVLSSNDSLLDDAKIFVGISNNEMQGLIVGNIAKHDKNGGVHHSSRKKHAKNERELDWFVTWGGKGVGKSLIGEFFKSMKELPFKKVFVRSEIPELSSAQQIYEHFGFKQVAKRCDWIKKTNNVNLTDEGAVLDNGDAIFMTIGRKQLSQTEQQISKQLHRKDLCSISTPLENLVK